MHVAVPSPTGGARPGGSPDDLAAVWAVITGMYHAFTAGDRPRIDSFLDPDATVFDSATPGLIRGKTELDEVRDRRPPTESGPRETGLEAHGETIDVFGHLALARYWLRVDYASLPARMIRNTAVLLRVNGSWRIIHLHEDLQQDLASSVPRETTAGR
ncbi:nuclear transport factor 2 family protein [Streptomyces sp. S.PB5]|uniref:nuclear transport factor 2 family protein n=1 Tax=Streptomyces sp. S.PB5 TaxID=3020844 RepID=UPI0025B064E7|nr:nuclear transport factor 2 family protein [Streptomyces sp. S.PB5]MDN3025853.1 nuclear transport factor 2 family protein [Streptomyces sp. S.PB5]